ncbi:MAG TPA: serpin family protein [Longimicrobium sp.]|jgi:serpin B|uniref:serpin family protein n=1 Tax=Longimicrobium sp. TaxID=2029185 RepID=UPI002EDBA653
MDQQTINADGPSRAPAVPRGVDYAAFGMELFRRLGHAAPEGNVVVSPLSAGLALGMLANGTTGDTLAEIEQTLATGLRLDALNAANAALAAALENDEVELALANSLWARAPLLPAFVEGVRRSYGAEAAALGTAGPVNEWVSRSTGGRIKEMMRDPINPLVILCLLNAVYFKGRWKEEFSAAATRPGTFHAPSGPVERPMMSRTGRCGYLRGGGFQAVRLPYRGDRIAMYVLLPDHQQGLTGLREMLAVEAWRGWMAEFRTQEVRVAMPRYRLNGMSSLKEPLAVMGMKRAFAAGRAELDAMLPAKYVAAEEPYVSAVLQKVFIEVNEEGTEAAAVTLVEVKTRGGPPRTREFTVDRPFIFAIRDDTTGALLFIGQVNDPVTEG